MNPKFSIRWATHEDKAGIVEMMRAAFRGVDEFAEMAEFFMSDLHACGRVETTCIAVEEGTGRIASAVNTAPILWKYEEIGLKALKLLLVGTHPDFRRCSAMKQVMDEIHRKLEDEKYDLSFVCGIPWYYRQHGYIPLALNKPARLYARQGLPDGREKLSRLSIRPLQREDTPFAVSVMAERAKGSLYSFTYDTEWVRMFAFDYFKRNWDPSLWIGDEHGNDLGVALCYTRECSGTMSVMEYALKSGVSYLDITPGVVQYLLEEGDRQMGREEGCTGICLPYDPGTEEVLKSCMSQEQNAPKHQCRLVDLGPFLMKIGPVLEKRLAESIMPRYTRTVNIQLYGYAKGLTIKFDKGRLTEAVWRELDYAHSAYEQQGDIQIPYEKMLQLVFGVECIDDMLKEHREVNSWDGNGLDNEMRLLLKVLFPKKRSHILHAC